MLGRLVRPPQLTSLTTSLLSGQTCKRLTTRPAQFSASEPDKPSATSEFLKSFGVLLEEPERAGVVGRWDWHLWQIFVMLLPPLGVAALAYFANIDMEKQEALLMTQKEQHQQEELAAQLAEPPQPSDSTSGQSCSYSCLGTNQMQAKLEALEDAIKLMHVRQLIRDMTGSAKIPLVGPVQDQAMQSTKALREGQAEAATPDTPANDSNSAPMEKNTQMLPEKSGVQLVKQRQAQQPHGTPAQPGANATPQPSAEPHEPMFDFASHPTAVDTLRQYAKKQFRWLLNSLQQSFRSSNKSDKSSSQHEQEVKHKGTD